jgi:hypothetical protein
VHDEDRHDALSDGHERYPGRRAQHGGDLRLRGGDLIGREAGGGEVGAAGDDHPEEREGRQAAEQHRLGPAVPGAEHDGVAPRAGAPRPEAQRQPARRLFAQPRQQPEDGGVDGEGPGGGRRRQDAALHQRVDRVEERKVNDLGGDERGRADADERPAYAPAPAQHGHQGHRQGQHQEDLEGVGGGDHAGGDFVGGGTASLEPAAGAAVPCATGVDAPGGAVVTAPGGAVVTTGPGAAGAGAPASLSLDGERPQGRIRSMARMMSGIPAAPSTKPTSATTFRTVMAPVPLS